MPVPIIGILLVGVADIIGEIPKGGDAVGLPKRSKYVRLPSIETKPSSPTGVVMTSAVCKCSKSTERIKKT